MKRKGPVHADVVIAGAGVAGLACALALADAGLRVAVYEAAGQVGGRASSSRDAALGDVIDIGPHVLTTEHRNFLAMLRRLGAADQVCWQPEPMITLLDRGKILRVHSWKLPTPLHGLPNLTGSLRCVSWLDLLSNMQLAWHAARLDEAATLRLDDEDALHLLRRQGVTQRFIDWCWAPICLALLNVPLHLCSAAALMRLLRLMLSRSGYHFGFPKCGLSELYAEPCRRTIEAAGGQVHCAMRVERVLWRDGRFDGFALGDGSRAQARCAVLAVPPDALDRLALPWRPAALDRFEPSPYVSTAIAFDRRVTRERFWARVWRPGDLNMDFYDLANIRDVADDAPSLVASNAIHAHAAMQWSDEAIVDRTLHEIVEFAPEAARARVRHAVVHRIPMAIPCPTPGSESRRPGNRTPLRGVWLAGDWTLTQLPASMESAARSGRLAAEQVAASLGHRLAITEPLPEATGAVALLRSGLLAAPA